jgi:hypothetical protein
MFLHYPVLADKSVYQVFTHRRAATIVNLQVAVPSRQKSGICCGHPQPQGKDHEA